jgi:hypothetical protein
MPEMEGVVGQVIVFFVTPKAEPIPSSFTSWKSTRRPAFRRVSSGAAISSIRRTSAIGSRWRAVAIEVTPGDPCQLFSQMASLTGPNRSPPCGGIGLLRTSHSSRADPCYVSWRKPRGIPLGGATVPTQLGAIASRRSPPCGHPRLRSDIFIYPGRYEINHKGLDLLIAGFARFRKTEGRGGSQQSVPDRSASS